MPVQTFQCPNCGAPLDTLKLDTPTIRCPFCSTPVIVPEDLRHDDAAQIPTVAVFSLRPEGESAAKHTYRWISWLVFGIALVILGSVVITALTSASVAAGLSQTLPILAQSTREPSVTATPTPTPTRTPTPTATPEYMVPSLSFGGEGIGPGLFSDARYIDLDQNGTVYVADYQGGRVQAFDSSGKYLRQWRLGSQKTIFAGLAASRDGRVYLSVGNGIAGVDGQSGEIVVEIVNPAGGTYGDLQVEAQGRLAAAWYEGRWGMITSLDGHREGLILYDGQGQPVQELPSFLSDLTGDLALDVYIAVDGKGTIYALNNSTVFKFTPEGQYVDRWDIRADTGGGRALVVDGQGRVYIGGSSAVYIYSPEGRLEKQFPVETIWDMAVDDSGNLWVVGRDKVTKYVISGW